MPKKLPERFIEMAEKLIKGIATTDEKNYYEQLFRESSRPLQSVSAGHRPILEVT